MNSSSSCHKTSCRRTAGWLPTSERRPVKFIGRLPTVTSVSPTCRMWRGAVCSLESSCTATATGAQMRSGGSRWQWWARPSQVRAAAAGWAGIVPARLASAMPIAVPCNAGLFVMGQYLQLWTLTSFRNRQCNTMQERLARYS
jgi:hypothetical protein